MTPKQRIISALTYRQPDAVPVTLGLSEMVPVRKSGVNYIQFFWREKRNLNHVRCDVEKAFGADVFIHSCESRSPFDPEIVQQLVSESDEEVIYQEVVHTGKGDLTSRHRIAKTESSATLKGLVDHPEQDKDKVLELLKHPDTKRFDGYLDDWNYVGDAGHCGFWISTPVDWWQVLRRSPEIVVYDILDYPELMRYLFDAYTEYAVVVIRTFLEKHRAVADSIGLGGSSTSMSVLSPDYLKRYVVGFVKAVKAVTSRFNVPLQYHMCGKSRAAIPILVEAGVDGMDALERPPTGDVDLAEIKRLFGHRISLRGNVNSIETMLHGKPKDVERDVIRCMNDAKSGGGFILGVGDQTPYWTPDENIFAMVEAGRKYGRYE